ncbi:MAG: thioredoxin domain-containing protein [Bacteroidetes bacterium]|nr:thioredoxin domain-containing protein [Bacteroidota bacterium]
MRDGAFDYPDASTLPTDGGPDFNRLVFTSSPYLLQHARNPVDWFPWGEEAFEKAAREDKPIFLSVGYSTCHWCHVMEHESFEDREVADYLNQHYVSIKVDREERPDIDHIYMTVCQAMTGSGGWPLTVFMTPDKKPFFSGTYFPKDDRHGRPGFLRVLSALHEVWRNERNKILSIGEELQSQLAGAMQGQPGEIPDDVLDRAVQSFKRNYDDVFGGFGAAPKFPMGHMLSFLLRRASATADHELLRMVEHTLVRMYRGGMWDHLGGGFCRYSVDRKWLVPHFEKMLYDNALLLMAYTDAFQITGKAAYRAIAEELITYVRRDMTDARGLFYSAENADSEGEEGRFYVFTKAEFDAATGEHGGMLAEYFGIEAAGNFEHGKNILHIAVDPQEWSARHGITLDEGLARVAEAKRALFEARARRIHPSLDDKILASWNGLMIAAIAQAGQAFDDSALIAFAAGAADALLGLMRTPDGTLLHRMRGDEAGIPGFLEDYAFVAWGLLDVYEATFGTRFLRQAVALSDRMLTLFHDDENAGLFFTAHDAEALIVRSKESHDGALPSGNSAAAYVLMRLARMTGDMSYDQRAGEIARAFGAQLAQHPTGSTVMLTALHFAREQGQEIVLTGHDPAAVADLARALRTAWLPQSVMLFRPAVHADDITAIAPYTATTLPINDEATAYVCHGFACELPVQSVDEMLALISGT